MEMGVYRHQWSMTTRLIIIGLGIYGERYKHSGTPLQFSVIAELQKREYI